MTSAATETFFKKENKMKNGVNGLFVVLALILSAFIWSSCTSHVPPTDEDVIKAIDASGVLNRADGSLTVIPPLKIVERGAQRKDGSWPVKVKITLTLRTPDGQTSPPAETMTSFRILRAKDDAGKSVWRALLGS
jgi:hypothetical protein